MKAKMIFTCNGQEKSVHRVFPALYSNGVHHLRVAKNSFKGGCKFGVAITQSSCYELSLMEKDKRIRLLKQIFGNGGLGLSIARLCIGASDYSHTIYSYDDVPFDTELKHFSVKCDEEFVIPMIKEILEINPKLTLFASPWSPPFWMKTGGSMCGGYMRAEYLDCYAEYIVKFIKAYEKYGIKISAVTPQNEPETHQSSLMPACVWHPDIETEFIKILKHKFVENGFDTKIWMHDHNFDNIHRVLWQLENDKALKECCDGVAFHYYGGCIEQTEALRDKYPQLQLHFTEGGPRLNDKYDCDWSKWGIMIIKALKCGYKSFTGWNLVLDELGGPNVGPFMGRCGGLVTYDNRDGQISYSGQYKAFSHIVPYINENSNIYGISATEDFGQNMSGYPNRGREIDGIVIDNGDNKTVAVIVNPNNFSMQTQIELCGEYWYLELCPDSISTIVIEK